MGTYAVIPESTFQDMQLDAGVLLKRFDPANPVVVNEDIITATTGGVQATCQPSYSDLAEDVDNVPNGMMEFQHNDGWNCSISTTALGTSPEMIRMSLGCADIDGTDTTKIVPRADLKQSDFMSSVWWVGDKANGGAYAIKLMNALSTGGLNIQSSKNGKGTNQITVTGHVSINAQDVMPMEIYDIPPLNDTYYTVTFDSDGGSEVASQSVLSGTTATEPVAPTKTDYEFDGWYTDSELTNEYDFSTPVTADIILYAKWVEET